MNGWEMRTRHKEIIERIRITKCGSREVFNKRDEYREPNKEGGE